MEKNTYIFILHILICIFLFVSMEKGRVFSGNNPLYS